MSYKGMNDRRRRRALIPFLSAANYISGILLTVLVEKRLLSEFQVEEDYLPPTLRTWPANTVRKFLWVIHSGALLLAGLSAPGQNLFWITDQDEIAANDQRVIDATPFVAGITSGYLSHSLGHLRFGTTACDCGDLLIEDVAAIPDLAAGALSEIPNVGVVQQTSRILTPMRGHISQKALIIGAWVGSAQGYPLRRVSLIVDHGDFPRTVRTRALDLPSEC